MKHLPRLFLLPALLLFFNSSVLKADYSDDMKFLGYTDELRDWVSSTISKSNNFGKADTDSASSTNPAITPKGEDPNALLEQLSELGRTRNLNPEKPVNSEKVKSEVDGYWKNMAIKGPEEKAKLPDSIKTRLKESILAELAKVGYTVKQIDLVDVPPNLGVPQVRLILRAVRSLKTNNSYKEIQENLAEIKQICLKNGTVDGLTYLSELTTFVAENPRNNFYYEKTVLTAEKK
ncbi:MAG: hypothetical protein HQM08_10375 [Candidatus Riflebacteria bacterium]|nr:hypothetical protein [Candidatus Riflebacteria bacterium]